MDEHTSGAPLRRGPLGHSGLRGVRVGCVENIGVFGCNRHAEESGLAKAIRELEVRGLVMHDSGIYEQKAELLGLEVDCLRHRGSVGARRLWR